MRLGKLVLVLGIGLLLVGPALAQPGGGGGFGGGFGGGGGLAGMIGNNQQLQDELKVSKEQATKVTEALAKVRTDLADDLAKLRDFNIAPEDRQKITTKMTEANNKALETVLKPEQIKRLHQIENQQAGMNMFTRDDVKTALKLSDKQEEQIAGINKDLQKDLRELGRGPGGGAGGPGGGRGGFGGLDPETQKKRQDLQKVAMDDVKKVLDDKQKATLKDLTGEPFTLTMTFGAGGGFGGGFGGLLPQPGQVLTTFYQDQLKLTAEQKKKLEDLQKDVDAKLEKILTDEQKKQMKDMQQIGGGGRGRGPGGNP